MNFVNFHVNMGVLVWWELVQCKTRGLASPVTYPCPPVGILLVWAVSLFMQVHVQLVGIGSSFLEEDDVQEYEQI
jgi:hypothetical protein